MRGYNIDETSSARVSRPLPVQAEVEGAPLGAPSLFPKGKNGKKRWVKSPSREALSENRPRSQTAAAPRAPLGSQLGSQRASPDPRKGKSASQRRFSHTSILSLSTRGRVFTDSFPRATAALSASVSASRVFPAPRTPPCPSQSSPKCRARRATYCGICPPPARP